MSATPLLVQRAGGLVHLAFNRPAVLHALDVATAHALLETARDLAADASVRAVMLTGTGPAFVAGGDLTALRADPLGATDALIGPLHEALRLLAALDAPLVAGVHGAVAGAGFSLMLAADFVVAAAGTRFNLAYVNIGTSCDLGASWALPRVVGLRKATEIAMLGETLEADEALRLGLVTRVVPAQACLAQTRALAERLAAGPTRAYGSLRRLLRAAHAQPFEAQLEAEHAAFRRAAATGDFREGLEAFFAKRTPQFKGS